MVFIHGGGFLFGGAYMYNAAPLVAVGDCVVVTIRYFFKLSKSLVASYSATV